MACLVNKKDYVSRLKTVEIWNDYRIKKLYKKDSKGENAVFYAK